MEVAEAAPIALAWHPNQSPKSVGSVLNAATLSGDQEVVENILRSTEADANDRTHSGPLRPSWRKLAMRVIVSACILAALFTQISVTEVMNNLRHVSLAFIIFAWCYYALCQWISAYRWQLLLRAKDVHLPLSQLFGFYMIGMFVNNFMPGSIGGDIVTSYYLFRRTRKVESPSSRCFSSASLAS